MNVTLSFKVEYVRGNEGNRWERRKQRSKRKRKKEKTSGNFYFYFIFNVKERDKGGKKTKENLSPDVFFSLALSVKRGGQRMYNSIRRCKDVPHDEFILIISIVVKKSSVDLNL